MKVLITRDILPAGLNILNIYSDRIEIDYHNKGLLTHSELKKLIKDVDAIVPCISDQIDEEIINAAGKNLKLIATHSVGYDHIDIRYATKKNIYVGNTPGDHTESVAEHALALMMAVGRNICTADTYCREKVHKYWNSTDFNGVKFSGKTLGIIGFGGTGQNFARIAKYGLNMHIIYNDIISHKESEHLLDAQQVSLDDLLENSDVISIHCRLYEDTKHLIGEPELRKMKPLAYLINTARGAIVDEAAVARALREKWISGAGLDVFENEPKINAELKKLKNVVLTPHIGSGTTEVRIQMSRMVAENIVDVLINNKPPRYLVNKELFPELNSISSLS